MQVLEFPEFEPELEFRNYSFSIVQNVCAKISMVLRALHQGPHALTELERDRHSCQIQMQVFSVEGEINITCCRAAVHALI